MLAPEGQRRQALPVAGGFYIGVPYLVLRAGEAMVVIPSHPQSAEILASGDNKVDNSSGLHRFAADDDDLSGLNRCEGRLELRNQRMQVFQTVGMGAQNDNAEWLGGGILLRREVLVDRDKGIAPAVQPPQELAIDEACEVCIGHG